MKKTAVLLAALCAAGFASAQGLEFKGLKEGAGVLDFRHLHMEARKVDCREGSTSGVTFCEVRGTTYAAAPADIDARFGPNGLESVRIWLMRDGGAVFQVLSQKFGQPQARRGNLYEGVWSLGDGSRIVMTSTWRDGADRHVLSLDWPSAIARAKAAEPTDEARKKDM